MHNTKAKNGIPAFVLITIGIVLPPATRFLFPIVVPVDQLKVEHQTWLLHLKPSRTRLL